MADVYVSDDIIDDIIDDIVDDIILSGVSSYYLYIFMTFSCGMLVVYTFVLFC